MRRRACRRRGRRHPSALISISNMRTLLTDVDKLEEARTLLEEVMQTSKETLWATATRAR